MENNIGLPEQKVSIKGGDLLKKFKSREDRYNFMREMSIYIFNFVDLYLPKEIGFDSNYFIQVLSGSKKVKIYLYNI